MPWFSTSSTAFSVTTWLSISASVSCSSRTRRASLIGSCRCCDCFGMIFSNMFWKSTSICSMPRLEKICTGTACCSTFSSTMRSSSSPASRRAFIFSAAAAAAFGFLAFLGLPVAGVGQQQVEQPIVDALLGLGLDSGALLLANHADGDFGQVADHALDIAADVADLGVLGRLDLEERGADQLGQPAGDLGFADAGGADHDDVLGRDVLAQVGRQLLAAPAIADGDGHGPLGGVLADDVTIQLLDDLARGQVRHGRSLRLSLQRGSGDLFHFDIPVGVNAQVGGDFQGGADDLRGVQGGVCRQGPGGGQGVGAAGADRRRCRRSAGSRRRCR